MTNRFYFSTLLLAGSILAFVGCNNNAPENDLSKTDTGTIDVNKDVVSAENIFVFVPSPIQTASLLKEAGAKYNKDFLNSPLNITKYSSTTSQALNLGIYGTDLAFAGIFDQHGETMLYMDCTGKLADALHVTSAFDADRHDRLEANMNNRDSVLGIITDSYWDCDALFHENNQPQASALMLAGGWVEGLYLACKVAESTNSNDIRVRIVEQRSSLDKLITLLDKQTNTDVQGVSDDLKKLKKLFDALPKKVVEPVKVSADNSVIGEENPNPTSLNDLEFNGILTLVSDIRRGFVDRN